MPTIKITDATVEPLTLAEVKSDLKIDDTEHDALISRLIRAARLACEGETQRTLLQTTWELQEDAFPSALKLYYPRVIAIESLKYVDPDGNLLTLATQDYQLDSTLEPGWVVPAFDAEWPDTRAEPNAVRARYTAGYGTEATSVPEDLRLWILLHVGHFYENRQAATAAQLHVLPLWNSLLDPYRIWSL
jgi:uncharacterized phiE125 gp8 family phage protein